MGLPTGTRLGPYEVAAQIGAGGMGEVYRARDTKLGRDVALKILPNTFAADPERLARFQREAQVLARLNHPHIAAIYGLEEADGIRALVLELVDGPTLAERIREGPLPIFEALRIAGQIVDAVQAAHEKGIIHRDLKPSNIKITPSGDVKVLDFGLAKSTLQRDSASTHESVTRTIEGTILGTPRYMSPEQTRGYEVDERTDIWAFGCVLYEMLTGRILFAGVGDDSPLDTIAGVLGREPDWKALPRNTPPQIRRLLRRCLEKDSDRRLRHIGEARRELEQALKIQTPRAPWLIAAVTVVIGGVGAAIWLRPSRSTENALISWEPRQLTFASGWEAEPALSPDGELVAYSSNESGDTNIWMVDVHGGNPQRVTNGHGQDTHPAWFPDGHAIAFESTLSGRQSVWKAKYPGGASELVMPNAADPAISPDGSQIAFARQESSSLMRIAVAPIADTSHVRFLTGDKDGLWDHRSPTWSPDGRTICYAEQNVLWLVRLDGSRPWRLTDGEQDHDPVWSTDGREVYFASTREGSEAIWRVSAGGGRPIRVTLGTGPERQPSVSPNGARLAYSTLAATSDIAVINLHTGKEQRIASVRDDSKPTFAPDGRALVFASDRWNGRYDLWIQQLVGGVPDGVARRLTDHPGHAFYPAISPDGRWIVYARFVDNRRDIWVAPIDGAPPTRITDGTIARYHPSWSPDGSRIVFVSGEASTYHIDHVRVADGRATGLPVTALTTGAGVLSPVWSADGSEIAYVANSEIWITPADGTGSPRQITVGAGAQRVRWNRATGHLFASGFWGTNRLTVRLVDAGTGKVTSPPFEMVLGETLNHPDFDISLDETIGAMDREELRGDIWVLENTRRP